MTAPRTTNARRVLLVMLAVVLAVVGYAAVAGGRQYAADRSFHPITVPAATPPAADVAAALAGVGAAPASPDAAATAPVPTAAGVAAALAGRLTDAGLGPALSAQVYDAATGASLFAQRGTAAVSPASTAKLLVAAAVLTAHKTTDRFSTQVVAGPTAGSVVLVGGGDPTLSGAAAGTATEYPEAGRVSDLAAKVRSALAGAAVTQVYVDDSLFTGATTAPGWAAEDAPSNYASPITAAMVDAGRDAPDADVRSAHPDLAAGDTLATALAGATVSLGRAPAGAEVLATVSSAPVGVLVEQMLRDSDNVIAEVLGRQVALAAHQPATFAGAAAAISATLAPLGVTVGSGMKDSSGLSVLDRVPASALSQTLLQTVGGQHLQLRPLISGLAIAGWDGTLTEEDRFAGASSSAYGRVRAKTGSLTGVSSLAGLVTDADGRLLVFVIVADRSPGEGESRVAIDALVAALANCGCR